MKGGRNLLQKGVRHPWRADQLRSRRIDVKINQGTCGCQRRGEENVKAFERGNDLGLCFVKTHWQNACNAGLNRHHSPDSACLLPTDRCAACKSDRNCITCACNRRKNSRIQAPMLDPHVRPFEGTVKLASLITAIVNEKSHACGPIGSGQLPCITSYYFDNPIAIVVPLEKLQCTGKKVPSNAFQKQITLRKRPSAQCAHSDGLLVSACVHFKKDRQKDRYPLRLKMPNLLDAVLISIDGSTSYQN
jgi:hypothetical protein